MKHNFFKFLLAGMVLLGTSINLWAGTKAYYLEYSNVSWWANDGSHFVHVWNSSENTNYAMVKACDNLLVCVIDDKYTDLQFYRTENAQINGTWCNQSTNISIGSNNYWKLTGKTGEYGSDYGKYLIDGASSFAYITSDGTQKLYFNMKATNDWDAGQYSGGNFGFFYTGDASNSANSSSAWSANAVQESGDCYFITIPAGTWHGVILTRNSVKTDPSWSNRWTQTGDITWSNGNNYLTGFAASSPSATWANATLEDVTIYFATTDIQSWKVNVAREGGTNNINPACWLNQEMTQTDKKYNGATIYSATIKTLFGGLDQMEFNHGDTWTPKAFEKEWKNNDVFSGKIYEASTSSWKEYNYDVHVTYHNNGHGTAPEAQRILHGNKATKPTDPVADGLSFDGWYQNEQCTGDAWNFNSPVNEDINLYAKWVVTLEVQAGLGISEVSGSVNPASLNTSYAISATPANGYHFGQWTASPSANATFSPNAQTANATVTVLNGSVTVTATGTPNTYTVTLDNKGATTAGSTSVMATYDAAMPSATMPAKIGYDFGGYYDGENGTGTQYYTSTGASAHTWNKASTATLYAKWTPANFTLSLTSDQQDGNLIHQIQKGSAIPITLTASATLNDNPYTLDLSHFDYTYKLVGSDGEPTPISTQTTNSTTWSAPTEVGHYTLTVSYNDGTITNKSASIDFVVWDEYTFYVWETGQDLNTPEQNANKVHVYHKKNAGDPTADYSETTWGDSPDGLRDITNLFAQWGGGWHSFTIKYPLYNFFIIGYNAYKDDKYQSNAYYLGEEPAADGTYLRCNYNSSSKWTWGGESISEPTKPQIEITAVNVYATKIVAKINVKPSNSIVTAHSFTVNGETKELPNFSTTDEENYNITLTNLTESTDYTFVVSATNALGTTEETQTITTLAKAPITFMIKVSSNLMANADNMWGWNNTTSVNLHYWNNDSGLDGDVELKDHIDGEGYWVYTYTIEDSPCSFFVYNHNCLTHDKASGKDRSANWNDANADGCALVQDELDNMNNHKITTQDYCTTRYQLVYTNSSNYKTYSNIIEDKDETLSLFVAPGGTLQMMQYDPATKKWRETPVFTTSKRPETAGVYNLNLVNVTDFEHIYEANLSDFTAYKGKYYIRTDAATGGWQEYLFADKDNAMTEFTPRRDKGENYSYYWVKNVAKNGTVRVSACVGNEFNPDLANMLTYDDFVRKGGDNHGYIDKLDGVGANVRFSYEPTTNEFKRAVIGGSSANDFLNVYSNDNNLYATKNGESLSDLLDVNQKEAAISRFNDVSDWVYEKVVYVKVVNEQSAANVILQSKFNSKTNYLLGYEYDKTTPKPLEVLGTGTNADTYTIRITYDYKKNRLVASWEPGTLEISTNRSINTDILFIQREDANGAIDDVDVAQITYADDAHNAKLTSLKNIIYVLEVTPTVMQDVAIDNQEYWITLPFNCRVSDVFGVEDYVKLNANGDAISGTWGIMRYDGETRASHGWFLDDYSTFWRWMTRDEIMNAGEGYVVIFDKTHADSWPSINVDGVNKQVKRLYFPSMNTGFTVSYSNDDSKVTYTNNPCTVEKRGDQDSNWKVLGPVSYNNIGVDNTKQDNLTFYYTYTQSAAQGSRYSARQAITGEEKFKSFHSFMTQFGGDLYWKPFTKSEDATTLKAPLYTENSEFQGGLLTIELNDAQGKELNHTFINLSKNGTTGFDRNLDLMKITENCAQIASVSEDVLYAGNTLPLDIETVPLNVKVVANGTYDIALAQSLEGLEVRLYDAFEQTTTPLDMMPATVTLDKGEYKDRFFLQFVQKSPLTPTNLNGAIEQFNLPTDKTQKLLINDNIYLINAGRIYNASGTQVK